MVLQEFLLASARGVLTMLCTVERKREMPRVVNDAMTAALGRLRSKDIQVRGVSIDCSSALGAELRMGVVNFLWRRTDRRWLSSRLTAGGACEQAPAFCHVIAKEESFNIFEQHDGGFIERRWLWRATAKWLRCGYARPAAISTDGAHQADS